MEPLTREYLESRGFHESQGIETGYRSQYTACTEDYSFMLTFLSTTPLFESITEQHPEESFEVVISTKTLKGDKWATVPTHIIVSTVDEFEMIVGMLDVELVLN